MFIFPLVFELSMIRLFDALNKFYSLMLMDIQSLAIYLNLSVHFLSGFDN